MSAVPAPGAYDPQLAIQRSLRLGMLILAALVVGLGGMSAIIGLNGAVIAPGQLIVASDVKKVQHPTGGVVADIRVADGARVREGDVLLAQDPTTASADVAIVSVAVDELLARQARLEAERDARSVRFPPELVARRGQPEVARLIQDELRLYRLRVSARASQKSQLHERENQLRQEIGGFGEESAAKQKEIDLIQGELVGIRKLYQQQLVPLTRLNSLEREAVQLHGDIAQLTASSAEARGKIAEVEQQAIQVDQDGRSDAGGQLSDVQNKLAELRQRKVTADQEFKRVLIRAPQSGVVDRLSVHTIGGVIAPGEAILYIVPDKDRLSVEAKIRPTDVDQLKAGEKVVLRFSAFDVRTTPEIEGSLTRVSADTHADERTGATYYLATIEIPEKQLARLNGLKLAPGMPVETFIQTGRRTLLSYLVKPLSDQFRRAFREG